MSEYFLVNHGGSANHGCESLVRTVNTLLGGKNTLMSDSPEEDFRYGLNDIINVLPATSSISKVSTDFVSAYTRLKLRKDYTYMDVLPYLNPIRAMNENTVAVSVGGDIYCYDDYRKYILIHRELAKKHKTVLLGCSLEKHLFDDSEFMEDMKSYTHISARESLTYSFLREAGFTNISFAPDTAFTLPEIELPLPKGFIENNTIGINVSPLIERKEIKSGIVRENYRQLIEYILMNTDFSLALFPHVIWNDNDDRTILKDFYEAYKGSERVVLIDDHNCMELKGFISRCRIFIGARTHATIAAYSSCVPTLVVGYSVKSKGIAADLFGTDKNYVLPVQAMESANDLTEGFRQILNWEGSIREHLKKKMPEYILKTDALKGIIRGL